MNIEAVDPESGGGGTQRLVSQEEVDDPWNLWVFRLNGNVNRNAEETSKNWQFNGGFNASRVTPTWKTNTNAFVNYRRIYRKLSSGDFFDYPLDWRVGQLCLLDCRAMAVGVTGRGSSTQNNQQLQAGRGRRSIQLIPYEEAHAAR